MKKLRVLSILLSAVMLITGLGLTGLTALAAETKLNKTSRILTPGETYTLKLNNATSSVTWSSSDKKIATVSSSGKVKAVKNGTVTITAKSNGKRYKCEVRVQRNRIQRANSTIKVSETVQCKLKGKNTEKIKWSSEDKSIATVNSKGVVTAKKAGKVKIRATFGKRSKSFTLTVKAASKTTDKTTTAKEAGSLKEAYESVFGYVGSAVYNYHWNGSSQLKDSSTLSFIKKHYNSITAENEMKPDSILGNSATTITVSTAKSRGYYIPDGFSESYVPSLDFGKIDDFLKLAYDNNLSVRYHTLVWHSQTPEWFFKDNYSGSGSYVSKTLMDKRMEMYVKTIIKHVCESKYGGVVYAWDVVNEYLNSGNNGGWNKIYGSDNSYVVNAFKYAHEMLTELNVRNKVSLFYNDYNTYENTANIVNLISQINKGGKKYCDGVGMQMHLDVGYPPISTIASTIDAFQKEGYEIQITELDVTLNGQYYNGAKKTVADQDKYYGDLFKMLIEKKKGGAKITSVTLWGLYDSVSWRGSYSPLLFTGIDKPKSAYTAVINAAK